VRTIIVESLDRFVRDLAVQLAGHDYLKNLGVALIPASAPEHFLEETPTAVLVRQVLGAIAQFEKAATVAKLKAGSRARPQQDGQVRGPEVVCRTQPCPRRRCQAVERAPGTRKRPQAFAPVDRRATARAELRHA